MHLLLTNDDGIDAEGLRALAEAVDGLGEIHVVAPDRTYSCLSHGITQDADIHVSWRDVPGLGRCCVVDGTPADCVRFGIASGAIPKPDVVLAGINHGGNLGVDIFYSGTVAAVREAAILGFPAIACSQYHKRNRKVDWPVAARHLRRVLEPLLVQPSMPGLHWNVNLPFLDEATARPAIRTTRVDVAAPPVEFELNGEEHPKGKAYRNTARYAHRPVLPGTDVEHVFGGGISVTPLHLDMMATAAPSVDFRDA